MTEFICDECDKTFKTKEAMNMHNENKHKKQPFLSARQKKRIRNYTITFVIIALIAAFIVWRSIPPKNAPIIKITPDFHNFGIVSQITGSVNALVTITNVGTEPLIISSMDTSCGCTSALILNEGIEGPKFSMASHGTNPKNWKHVIPPGESSQLKIIYDPNVHKDLQGTVTRSVFVHSNDPRNRRTEVRISATQTA
jgi:hypothetical protein